MEKYDVVIVGGGILGTSLSYWISLLYEGRIAVLEMEESVAFHTSGRNTGIIHRPFYLDPQKRKVFARSAQISFGLWKKYAAMKHLPWKEIGTIEVATNGDQLKTLEKYLKWALENGMEQKEVELLNADDVRRVEPNVICLGALYAKTDTSVDYKAFTQALKEDAVANGVQFLFGFKVQDVRVEKNQIKVMPAGNVSPIEAKFLLNCAGGNSVDIAHFFGAGLDYTDLHFRGEYLEIAPEQAHLVNTNIYSVPRHPDLPFLDPHWIVRENGKREIGPNAVLVAGSKTYEGFFNDFGELVRKVFERPLKNKLKLFINPDFLKLASEEWMSSISKHAMIKRIRKFIPNLKVEHLLKKGTAGIRSSVINSEGRFVKEAIEFSAPCSYHIINYNSPGATGAPVYTAYLVDKLAKNGVFSHLKKRKSFTNDFWNFEKTLNEFYS